MEKKILVVDDEQDILDLISYNLSKEGFKVFTAADGIQGLETAKTCKPDLVILDIMMPLKDGFSLAREIRVTDEITPIIFVTARSLKEDVIKGFKVAKPLIDFINEPLQIDKDLI